MRENVVILLLGGLFIPGTLQDDCPSNIIFFINTPKTLEALSGSCLHIPCSFRATNEVDFDSKESLFGVWIKNYQWDPSNAIFNSSKPVNIYPMNITGNLREKNCSTLFSDLNKNYSHSYYFRMENGPHKATAACDSLQINVRDSAWSPSIKVSGDLKDLKEGESVSITCSARTPCPDSPPELTWSLQQNSQRTEKNPDEMFTTKIQTNVTLSDTHDGDTISCSVRYPVDGGKRYKTAGTNVTLSVSYAPKCTSASISPSGVVSAGSWVQLSCSSRAKPPVRTFTWFWNTKHGPVHVSEGQVYSFNASEGGQFYCVATNDLGNQTSPVVFFNVEGPSEDSLPWVPIVAGFTGMILLLVFILTFVCLRRAKKRNPLVQQLENQSSKEERVQNSPKEKEEEEIHYGEFKLSNQTSNSPSTSTHEQDTVYAQVKANPSTRTAEGPEDLYAQVMKK